MDFDRHNAEVSRVWDAYKARKPIRVPFFVGVNSRYTMFDHPANPTRVTYEQYWSSPEVMLHRQLEHLEWCAVNIEQDAPMGLPDKWGFYTDFQNVHEAAAFGCPIRYFDDQVPDTLPILTDENKRFIFDAGVPDPFSNPFWDKIWEFYDYFKEREREGYEWKGRPIEVLGPTGMGTDGPLTVACNLRGAMEFCLDLLEDPLFADDLLDLITEAAIRRISAFRERLGRPAKDQGYFYADDSIALISTDMLVERIIPHHRRLIQALAEGGPHSIHLCGDATRHFPTLQRVLNIQMFDTGFPVDFGAIRRDLGEEAEIWGGPSVPFLASANPGQTIEETRRILESGVLKGGRFVLREGNNLAPEITTANISAMYRAVKTYGVYAA